MILNDFKIFFLFKLFAQNFPHYPQKNKKNFEWVHYLGFKVKVRGKRHFSTPI